MTATVCRNGVKIRYMKDGTQERVGPCKPLPARYCVTLRDKTTNEVVSKNCHRAYEDALDEARMNRGFWKVSIGEKRKRKPTR